MVLMTVDWAELLPDLLTTIAKKLNLYEDFTAFAGVCRSWRSVAVKNNFSPVQVPWLLLAPPENDDLNDSRDFYSLTKGGMVHKVHLPEARCKKLHSSRGWLITMDTYRGDMELLHPLSRARIPLPSLRECSKFNNFNSFDLFSKAALSASPSDTDDYALMIVVEDIWAYWKNGNIAWVPIYTSRGFSFHDLIYHSAGQFYAINYLGELFSIDINGPNPTTTTTTTAANLVGTIPSEVGTRRCFLAESGDHLLVVVQKIRRDEGQHWDPLNFCYGIAPHRHHGMDLNLTNKPIYNYVTTSFQVYKFDSSNKSHKQANLMNDLGGSSLFLSGVCSPVTVPCVVGAAIKPDCIYFTDPTNHYYIRNDDRGRNGIEMGVYSLKEQRMDTLYQGGGTKGRRCSFCPLIWVIPSF